MKFILNRPIRDGEYVCYTWFERDRKNVRLETPKGRAIFDLWDDEVVDEIESGHLTVPRTPRPLNSDWQPHAVAYAKERELI